MAGARCFCPVRGVFFRARPILTLFASGPVFLYICISRGAARRGRSFIIAAPGALFRKASNGFGKKVRIRAEKALLAVKTRSNGGRATAGSCRAAIELFNKKPAAKRQRRLKTLKSLCHTAARQRPPLRQATARESCARRRHRASYRPGGCLYLQKYSYICRKLHKP